MLKKGTGILIFALFLFLLTGCSTKNQTDPTDQINATDQANASEQSGSSEEKDSTAQRLEDLNFVYDNLVSKHKNAFAFVSEAELLAEKQRIESNLEGLSDAEFYFELKRFVSKLGDAHTNVYYSDSVYKHLMALPFAMDKYGDAWHLMMLDEENHFYMGAEVFEINGVKIADVYEKSKAIMSYENEAWATTQFSNTINFKEALEAIGVVEKDAPIKLTVKSMGGVDDEIEVKPLSWNDLASAEIDVLDGESYAPTWLQNGNYSAKALDADHFYIQYNVCEDSSDLPIKDFAASIASELEANAYKKVIIDLRYNSGGNSDVIEPLLEMLKKQREKGNLTFYTLIGGKTFSSAIINAVQLKDELGSILVGSPTGGNVNHFGEVQSFELPNAPMIVTYSVKYFEMIDGYDKDSLYPDHEVTESFDDFIKGIDTAVEWIKKQ